MSMPANQKFSFGPMLLMALIALSCKPADAQEVLGSRAPANLGVGLTLKSNGYGLFIQAGKATQYNHIQRLLSVDIVTAKHQREVKIMNQGAQNPSPYVFGKLYHSMFARAAFGYGKSVIHRSQTNKLGVELLALIGPTLSIQRPVYLDIMSFGINDQIAIINSELYNPDVHKNQNNIVGYSRKSKDLKTLKYTAGIGFKPAINFYWGNYSQSVKQLHLGMMIDYFPTGLEIMAFGENPNVYFSPYLTFVWSFNMH
jgi:hypothetical protein